MTDLNLQEVKTVNGGYQDWVAAAKYLKELIASAK